MSLVYATKTLWGCFVFFLKEDRTPGVSMTSLMLAWTLIKMQTTVISDFMLHVSKDILQYQ